MQNNNEDKRSRKKTIKSMQFQKTLQFARFPQKTQKRQIKSRNTNKAQQQ